MLNNYLNDLVTKLKDFDIDSCIISMEYDEYFGELKVELTKINNSSFRLDDFDIPDHYFKIRFKEESFNSKLLETNLKFQEMKRLFNFVEEFRVYYSTGTAKIPIPKTSWWNKFKYKCFGTMHYSTEISAHKYTKNSM